MISNILKTLIESNPGCTCCDSDIGYVERVADIFSLVPPTLWPSINTAFTQEKPADANRYRSKLKQLLDIVKGTSK